jgi:hypothetical protein
MDPAKVNELIHVLGLARDEAQQTVVVRGKTVVREITSGPMASRNRTIDPKQPNP